MMMTMMTRMTLMMNDDDDDDDDYFVRSDVRSEVHVLLAAVRDGDDVADVDERELKQLVDKART